MQRFQGLALALGLFIGLSVGCGASSDNDDEDSSLAAGTGLPLAGMSAGIGAAGIQGPPSGAGGVAGTVPSAGAGGIAGSVPLAGSAGDPVAGSAGVGGNAGSPAGAGGGGSGGSAPMTCTGKPGGSGNETRMWNGLTQYIVHFPAGVDPNKAVPLVFVAHGFTMSGALMQSITGFDALSDREGFVVVYPNGDGGATPWNVGPGACAPGSLVDAPAADSFGYLDGMRASIEETQCIHPQQIFITGFSMGGYFSNNVGCQRGNSFARAAGPHSGGTYPGDCPGAPVPMFVMHGDADSFIDYRACGQGARDLWLGRNGCGQQSEPRMVTGGTCDWYMGCDPNGQTVFCSFSGVGHSWAQGAGEAVWSFFKGYL